MKNYLRVAAEEVVESSTQFLSTTFRWHPSHAPLIDIDAPPPSCYYEFMAWAKCVDMRRSGVAAKLRLFECVHKHTATEKAD